MKYMLYKGILVFVTIGLLSTFIASGQAVNNPATNIPESPAVLPSLTAYPGLFNFPSTTKKNYIVTWVPDAPTTVKDSAIKHRQVTDFIDGLGRPLQSVQKRAHADGNDLVQHHFYDGVGRESVQYLPYAKQEFSSLGQIDYSPKVRMEIFYPLAQGEQPYSQTVYDNSPLNRPVKQMSPGKSWVGSNRGSLMEYKTNGDETYFGGGINPTNITVKSSFPRFSVDATGTLQYDGNYADGTLYLTKVTDEDGNITEECKDNQGRLILKRSLSKNTSGIMYPAQASASLFPVNYVYTIYVYDDLDRLRYVLPPSTTTPQLSVSSSPGGGGTINTYTYNWSVPTITQREQLCYTYQYDTKSRIIEKRIPGKGIVYMVYDKRDRVVLTQDGNLKQQGKWMFVFYDVLNRPTTSGLLTIADDRASLQSQVNSGSVGGGSSTSHWLYFVNNYTEQLSENYPINVTNGFILSYNYYDNYTRLGGFSFDPSKIPAPPANDNTIVPSVYSNAVRGLTTGSKIRIMDPDNPSGNEWITTVNYYDAKGRLIQSQQNNLKGGTEISSNLYYFQGMAYEGVNYHQNPDAMTIPGANAALTSIKLDKKYKRNLGFGGNDQIWNIQQSINDGAAYNIAYYDYNHLGQPVVKQYTIANVLQEYNIRGWLKHIQARNPVDQNINYFNETIHYDDGFGSKLYSGKIAGTTWNYYNEDDNVQKHAYGYSYDKLNRLTHAEYRNNHANPTNWVNDNYDYTNSNITYDDLGNIQTMNHRGNIGGNPGDMDILKYIYAPNSNKLVKVSDAIAANITSALPDFKDNANLAEEFTYDVNGNLLSDANKDISGIAYNYLNKPEKLEVNGKGSITYVYDATGNLLQKRVADYQAGNTDIWDYMGNFVYKNDLLQYILNEEGRCRPQVTTGAMSGQTKFVYDYFIKDHLGNVRSTIEAEPANQQYLARHEIATANAEQLIFDNIAAVRADKPGSINLDDTKAARLIADDPAKRIGTAIMLRVMPGDRFTFATDAYYESSGNPIEGPTTAAEDIVTSLIGALTGGTIGGVPVSESGQSGELINQALGNSGVTNKLENILNDTYTGSGPKAGLNYLFFDKNMKLMSTISGSLPVNATPGVFENVSVSPAVATEPGYVVVYVDNRSIGTDVWFDNVQVSHYSGQVLEEDHYYPFGLAITDNAAGNSQPYKYQGIELEKNFGLETYETFYRGLDPQLGRFNQLDPKAEVDLSLSPYVSMRNNPASYTDPMGDCPLCGFAAFVGQTYTSPYGSNYRVDGTGDWGREEGMLGEVTASATRPGSGSSGSGGLYGDGGLNVWQASNQDIGRNDYNRSKVAGFETAMKVWGTTGAAPFVLIAGAELAPSLMVAYLSNPMRWNEAANNLLMGSQGYAGESPTGLVESASVKAGERGLVNLTEETFSQAVSKGAEKISGYSVYGTNGLVGSTYNVNVFLLEASAGKSLSGFRTFIGNLEGRALDAGASKISIYGSSVINKGFLNPNIARRFGYSFEQSGTGVFLQKNLKQ
ncbi:DUF6443 domain-containing protein [Taibaiella sp. KBW10]|uniref:DUF6443 domain-containing protein n=1 Tax=Taibaiella sp. KBW10 TaxID=2153357 RepID=UPI00131545FC|nr:DUF6443 domain-containing protein [Taibaiella sp. KBW10]